MRETITPPASLTLPVAPAEFPSPTIVDSRRLLGPNVYSARTGAVLEVTYDDARAKSLIDAWSLQAAQIIHALRWADAELHVRRGTGGASLFLAAPVDALMTATEVNEQAWVGAESPSPQRPDRLLVERLRDAADRERLTRPNLAAVHGEAVRRGLNVTFDDETLSVGSGTGAQSWPLDRVPVVDAVTWDAVHDVPIAVVTGSNGKTTTVRLVGAMWRAAHRVAGWSCSDGVWADDAQLEKGDYSGPAGARVVLRDTRVEAAILETARGGILRRGLAVTRADAAIITNISPDHFGEYGIDTVRQLAEAKGAVARVVGGRGRLVLNADDPLLVDLATELIARRSWFSVLPAHPELDAHVLAGGDAATVQEGRVMLHLDRVWHDLGAVDAMPITLRGAAPHNVQNILGAALLGAAMGVPVETIRYALASFGASAQDNPGRLQLYRFGGVTVLVDYAHNPDGVRALCETAKAIPARRRLLLLGQAGNRDDAQIRELARVAWSVVPFDLVIIKEMATLLRGRAAGEVPRLLAGELARLGVPPEQVELAESELAAVRRACEWAHEGDLLVCPVHVEKAKVLAWLGRLDEWGWRAGAPLPD